MWIGIRRTYENVQSQAAVNGLKWPVPRLRREYLEVSGHPGPVFRARIHSKNSTETLKCPEMDYWREEALNRNT